jgi:Cytochrome c554 and c-prime
MSRTAGFLLMLLAGASLSWINYPQSQPSTLAQATRSSDAGNTDKNSRVDYIGDAACRSCHEAKVDSFHRTAHSLTSQLPSEGSILGDFGAGNNVLKTSNPDLLFRMEAKNGGFFQTAIEGQSPHASTHSEAFDLVIGSGGKGQTYLYWKGDELFQLPVSYWNEIGWVNSPGYRDGVANFDRPIIPRCLECHATFFEALPPPPNRYRKSGFTVGITCEKCHGPGKEHAHLYSSQPQAQGSAIINPARLSRDRQMDLCAWCHAGHGRPLRPWFSYAPGQPLAEYIEMPPADEYTQIDVHGSQVELLKRSRCFESSKMTCVTCHDVHTPQHNLADFSAVCMTCHKVEACGVFAKQGRRIADNCIDCHMPKQSTNLIVFNRLGQQARPEVRNHWIGIYSSPLDTTPLRH